MVCDQFAHLVVRGVAHVDAEHVGAGLEQLADHRAVGRCRAERGEDLDTTQPPHCFGRRGWRQTGPARRRPARRQTGHTAGAARADRSRNSRHALLRGLFVGFGQLHGPGSLLAGVDLEEAGAVEAARQAILGALDGEFLVARTHEGLSRPLAAAVVVEGVDVIEPCDQRSAQQRLATARGHVPPALGGPALGVLVAERDADPARGVVAEPKVGRRRTVPQAHQRKAPAPAAGRRSCEREGGGARRIFCSHAAKLYQMIDDFAWPGVDLSTARTCVSHACGTRTPVPIPALFCARIWQNL